MTGALATPRPRLRLVEKPYWQRRLEVRISVADGRAPIGRTRLLRLTEHAFERLLAEAERLETRA
jgi:hypothetical protein